MKLKNQDADLFFELMWSLQNFVNLKLEIIPGISTVDEYQKLSKSEKIEVREALYDNADLMDEYVEENPQGFDEDKLAIVKSWKQFKRGKYFIERFLKKYAVFIGDEKVYGVLALYDPFEEILADVPLPYYVNAVLLPFKGKIIYDGLILGYGVSFGSNYKYDLKETYMAAKQNRKIIVSFDPEVQAQKMAIKKEEIKDWGPELEEISTRVEELRSSRDAPAIRIPAFSMIRASVEFAKLAVENPDDIDELWEAFQTVERAVSKTELVLQRSEY